MSFDLEKLYARLPAVYRTRDTGLAGQMGLLLNESEETELQNLLALGSKLGDEEAVRRQELLEKSRQARGPLKALLSVLAEQVAVLEEDLDQLYDDLFIETCAEWVVPYIGDLVGARGLFVFANAPFSQRAQAANTLAYRRRKGTAAVLEQLARDATAWNASVVEYFQLLATTQYMNHVRPENLSVASLRNSGTLEFINTPFDKVTRTADVRRIESRRGKYNIPNVGIFLWRIGSYPVTNAPAYKLDDHRYLFDALGKDAPLYNQPETEDQITHLAETINVPMPISRRALNRNFGTYYGVDANGEVKSILLKVNGKNVIADQASPPIASPPLAELYDQISVCDLSDLKDSSGNITGWAHRPSNSIAIDPVLGRIAFPEAAPPPAGVRVIYHYGFSAEMGGGEYGRATTFVGGLQPVVKVPSDRVTIQDALDQLTSSGGVVEIEGNDYFVETPSIIVAAGAPRGNQIELRAADERRPIIVPAGEMLVFGGDNSEVTLNGLLISGGSLHVPFKDSGGNENKLRLLRLRHCTFVPGPANAIQGVPARPASPSLFIEAPNTIVEIEQCIVGSISAVDGAIVRISNSIIDATDETGVAYADLVSSADGSPSRGAPLKVENSTIIGKVFTLMMELASNTIFLSSLKQNDSWPAPVRAERLQQGCTRFSFVPPGSQLPRLYNCQPASVEDAARVRPVFTSLRYGDAGYCQLSPRCAVEITRGADDQAEMGAFHDLYQPQREDNIRAGLDEYLRFGLEAGIFYAS
ncbi:MAG: hypothetical protein ACLGJB_06620 [Blastocatellia bacterium]